MIKELKEINFHDLDVERLELDLAKKLILLEVSIYDENIQDYKAIKIEFEKLSNIGFDDFFDDGTSLIEEISSFDLVEGNPNKVKFVFLQGFSKPSCELTFNFKNYTIK